MKRRFISLAILFIGISWANYYLPQDRFINVPSIIALVLSLLAFFIVSTPLKKGESLDKKHNRLLVLTYASMLIPITVRVILYFGTDFSYYQKLFIIAPCAYLILIPAWFYTNFNSDTQ